ncbi:MAG: hypothetical protein Q4G70_01825 [Pseudomonadota bacterium]|nr:hypothetical protein [Pseudomonadota bacterium]
MSTDFRSFDRVHLLGERAMHPIAPRWPHHAALLVLAGTRRLDSGLVSRGTSRLCAAMTRYCGFDLKFGMSVSAPGLRP